MTDTRARDLALRLVQLSSSSSDDLRVRAQTVCIEAFVRSLLKADLDATVFIVQTGLAEEPLLAAKARRVIASVPTAPKDPRQGTL